jgi:hypothetical protein
MAAVTHGMNIEEVKLLARKLDEKANQIGQIAGEVNGVLNSAAWVGPDAQAFKSKWQSEGTRQLNEAKQILTTASHAANANAAAQESTSQAGTGNF